MNRRFRVTLATVLATVGLSQTVSAAPLRIAADAVPHSDILRYVQKIDPALDLKVIELSGGLNANELLARGDVDANFWQHIPFMQDQEKALGQTFVVVATVHLEPLGIYTRKSRTLAALPDKATVALPNNDSNLSRALYLLQANGLIRLKPGFDTPTAHQATLTDIADNPHHLKLIPLESAQVPRALDDVDLTIINGNFALAAGLTPAKDALALESLEHNPYANVIVTVPKLKDDPRILRLVRDVESPEVAAFIRQHYAGSVIPVNHHD